jgi:hypothetical protein
MKFVNECLFFYKVSIMDTARQVVKSGWVGLKGVLHYALPQKYLRCRGIKSERHA